MGIFVEKKGNSIRIETNQPGGAAIHNAIYDDRQLLAAMESSGIREVEVKKEDAYPIDVVEAFEEKYKEKTGHYRFK